MEKKEELFADIKQEGNTDPFAEIEETITPSESQTENEQKKEEPVVGDTNTPDKDDVPFHEHPRWKQREKELEDLRDKVAQFEQSKSETPVDTKVPEWFRELYGDNAPAWEKYNENHTAELDRIRQEAVQFVEQKAQAEVAETQKWNKWVEDEVGKLSAAGKQFDRNELIKTMLDYRPTDPTGNFDFEAGYKIYEALHPKDASKDAQKEVKSQARKMLADSTASTTTSDKKSKDYMTQNDFRGRSWTSILE